MRVRRRWMASIAGVLLGLVWMLVWAPEGAGAAESLPGPGGGTSAPPVAVAAEAPSNPAPVTNVLFTLGLDRVPWLQQEFLGMKLWRYLASLVYLLLAIYGSRFVDHLLTVRLRRFAARTASRWDDLLIDMLHGPVRMVALVIFLHIGLEVLEWPAGVRRWISAGLIVLVAVSLTYLVIKLVDLGLGMWQIRMEGTEDKVFRETLLPAIRKTARVILVIGAALLTADNLGIEIKTILAGLSVGGLALGLAGQETVANLIGAIVIFLDKPFKIGDRIVLEGVDGVVESIGLRSTRIRNLDGHLVTVPNKTLTNATITNITLRPNIRTLINIGITYNTPAERVQRAVDILSEIYRAHPMTHDVWISFNKFNDASLNIFVVHWWKGTDFKQYLAGMQELNLRIKARFDAEGIEFAFPTQTLYVKQGSDWRIHGGSDPLPPVNVPVGASGSPA
ncbi:mechanosensitive ion channel family protein [Limisphaera sp. 4302-co]|uniref:mechanosensitive ion channel family protein n=1 Tax=Limisphaera sp. 4302-co TaxID=3400417 RepID=UPI003C1D3C4B